MKNLLFPILGVVLIAFVMSMPKSPIEQRTKPLPPKSHCTPVDSISDLDRKSFIFKCSYETEDCYIMYSVSGVAIDCMER